VNSPYPIGSRSRRERGAGGRRYLTQGFLVARLTDDAKVAYDVREAQLGAEILRELERRVLMEVADR